MPGAKTTIWCNAKWPETALQRLQAGLGDRRLILAGRNDASNLVAAAQDPALAKADVAFGQPDPAQVIALANLKWVHLTSAGYTRYDTPEVRQAMIARGARMSNSSSVYDEPCAEHVLAMMLALARRLPEAMDEQRGEHRWHYLENRSRSHLLVGQTVLLAGFGAIARRLVELLQPFHMNVMAVRRTVKGDEPVPTHPAADIDALLPSADHVVNLLPAAQGTAPFFTADRFAKMKPTAHFYNVGRGTTVDQNDLVAALYNKQIAAAYLDVFDPEPLPPDHLLWRAPNCFITPHTAGGHATEYERLVAHFLNNLSRFESGEPLVDQII